MATSSCHNTLHTFSLFFSIEMLRTVSALRVVSRASFMARPTLIRFASRYHANVSPLWNPWPFFFVTVVMLESVLA
jgi:hypothetical protein